MSGIIGGRVGGVGGVGGGAGGGDLSGKIFLSSITWDENVFLSRARRKFEARNKLPER